ncbi:7129_t:CDS:2, partial [Paraglomus occultum]
KIGRIRKHMTQSATVPTIYKGIILRQTPFSFDGMELELSKTGIVEDAENLKNDQLDTELIQTVTLQEVTKARPEEAIFEPQELPTPTRREIESWTPDQVYAHICRVIPEILHEDNEETRKILNAEKIDGRAFILCGEDDFANIEINHADALGREVYRLRVERSPDFEDIAEMNAEQVAAFLIARAKEGELELQKDDLNIISYWKIPGIALLQQDEERLIRLGLPEKSANYIAKVINRIRGEYGILSMPMYRKPDGIT